MDERYEYILSDHCKSGDVGGVLEVVDKVEDLSWRNNNFLFNAIKYNNIEIIKILIDNGADINYNPDVIYVAIQEDNLHAIKCLITNGLDLTNFSEHIFYGCSRYCATEILHYLLNFTILSECKLDVYTEDLIVKGKVCTSILSLFREFKMISTV
jgi:hypothetical protein